MLSSYLNFVSGPVRKLAGENRVNFGKPQRVMPVVIQNQAQGSAPSTWEGLETRLVTSARNNPVHERPTPKPALPAGGDIVPFSGETRSAGINSLLQDNETRPRLSVSVPEGESPRCKWGELTERLKRISAMLICSEAKDVRPTLGPRALERSETTSRAKAVMDARAPHTRPAHAEGDEIVPALRKLRCRFKFPTRRSPGYAKNYMDLAQWVPNGISHWCKWGELTGTLTRASAMPTCSQAEDVRTLVPRASEGSTTRGREKSVMPPRAPHTRPANAGGDEIVSSAGKPVGPS